jgi:hypothetical protein
MQRESAPETPLAMCDRSKIVYTKSAVVRKRCPESIRRQEVDTTS